MSECVGNSLVAKWTAELSGQGGRKSGGVGNVEGNELGVEACRGSSRVGVGEERVCTILRRVGIQAKAR
jgi:hypothetical protein